MDCRGEEYYSVERGSRKNNLHVSKVLSDLENESIGNKIEVSQRQIAEARYVIDPSLYSQPHVEIPEGYEVSPLKDLTVGYDFKNTEEIRLPLEPTDTQIRECVEKARNADLIVYGMCNAILYDEQVKLAEELNKLGKKVVVVAMDSPFDVELIPYFDDVVATYGVANDSMLATMDVICGRKEGDAVPPVTIPNL